jgi:putative transposase
MLGQHLVERLWWTIKRPYRYRHPFSSGTDLRRGLTEWVDFYNHERSHSSIDDRTPDEVYYGLPHPLAEVA